MSTPTAEGPRRRKPDADALAAATGQRERGSGPQRKRVAESVIAQGTSSAAPQLVAMKVYTSAANAGRYKAAYLAMPYQNRPPSYSAFVDEAIHEKVIAIEA